MARQKIHNRRAGGRGSAGGGPSWISYSDMMAALVMVFVLILSVSLYRHFSVLQEKELALQLQQQALDQANLELQAAWASVTDLRIAVGKREEEVNALQIAIGKREEEVNALQIVVAQREEEVNALQLVLGQRIQEVTELELQLQQTQQQLASLLGVRPQIIQELKAAFDRQGLPVKIDDGTGEIVLDSTLVFELNSTEIKTEGKAFLDQIIPIYLNVLQDHEADLGAIVIEGYADSDGDYLPNMVLSIKRAQNVATYVLNSSLTAQQRRLLEEKLSVSGRSESDPVIVNGVEDKAASRRVEIKFSLKDDETISQMSLILQGEQQ